jgi:DNA gyrase inhibitor GyrI
MRRKRIVKWLYVIVIAELIIIAGIWMHDSMAQDTSDVQVRQLPPQTVLYTIYRGRYDMIGEAMNRLYDVARRRGLCPCGPISTGYLNDPTTVAPEHWLIEIRLPVDDGAISLAGMLGPMIDVKRLVAMKVAVAVKPQGRSDPSRAIESLQSWINSNGYVTVDRLWQTIVTNKTGNYSQMETEFVLPIEKSPPANDCVFKVRSASLY